MIAQGMLPYELYRIPKQFLDSMENHQIYYETAKLFHQILSRVDRLYTLIPYWCPAIQ
ncbi:hypothetical protein [Corallincola spongiicola]|uniref:hypothetical protein n=1 Tax=Corallincola spongiicola TaxID=2520508 RepID=UPI0013EE40FC|nr:hypothetical protein [Corallincola spongiicola]